MDRLPCISVTRTIVGIVAWLGAGAAGFAEDIYRPIPDGFGFPGDQEELLRFRDTEDVSAMRRHAWHVFAGMTQPTPGGEAVWETWYPSHDVFRLGSDPQDAGPRKIERRFTVPRQSFVERIGVQPQSIGESLLSFVLFNQEGRAHIRSKQLYLQNQLNAINDGFPSSTPVADRRIDDFPRRAISLKTVWWPVQSDGVTPLPIWDFDPTRPDSAGNDFPVWRRVVAVDSTRISIPDDETTNIAFMGVPHTEAHVVSLTRFYEFEITAAEIGAAGDVLNSSAQMAFGRDVRVGDHAVLVAFHYTTKEIPDWVWATFWWHDRPDDGPYAADRTSDVLGPWRNYLMDVAFSMDVPREYDGTPNAMYNPWLEARFPDGMQSNCMTCHQRAVWPPVGFLPITRGSAPDDAPIFRNRTKLDFLWSVAFESNPQP